ncbi:MAG: enoyl-CoA hydratase-related protein [Burkholderiaceae bacterium]
MSEQAILCNVDAGVATITLNRPTVLNALNAELMDQLKDTVQRVGDDASIRAVVITGAGRGFSAGADLASRSGGTGSAGETLRKRYHPTIEGLRAMPKPVITAVNGVAAGAGMSIALAGDIVLAAESASFLQAFSKIGLVPDAGSTYFLPRYVGDVRARALAILADKISAADALAYGMVWKVYPDAALQDEAQKLARHLATMPTRAYALIKQALNGSGERSLSEQLELEATLQDQAGQTADFKEGVAAFLAKRPPNFQGK